MTGTVFVLSCDPFEQKTNRLFTWGDAVSIKLLFFWQLFTLGDGLSLCILGIFGRAETTRALLVHLGTRGNSYKRVRVSACVCV